MIITGAAYLNNLSIGFHMVDNWEKWLIMVNMMIINEKKNLNWYDSTDIQSPPTGKANDVFAQILHYHF